MNPLHSSRSAAALTALLLSACVTTTTTSLPATRQPSGPWLEATPVLRERIEDARKRLPWTHGIERVEIIQWFAGVGEPAYETLLELAADPRKDVASAALAALGATRDSRLVEHLHALPRAADEGPDFALERARTLLRLGDWGMVPSLIAGLRHERLLTRALCAQALWEATHERFDYDPRAQETPREEAIRRWEDWWKARQGDPLLGAAAKGAGRASAPVSLQDP